MELDLEVSESEDYSEFPEGQTTQKLSSESGVYSIKKRRSSGVTVADKSTQTLSRKVWRKKKKQAQLKLQNARQISSTSS